MSLDVAVVLALAVFPALAQASVVWTGYFEPGNLSQYANAPWNFEPAPGPSIVTSPVRQGRYAARFERSTSQQRQESPGPAIGHRAEGDDS